MKIYTLAALCLAILTTGCAVGGSSSSAATAEKPKYAPPNWNDPATVQARTKIKEDEFTKKTTYIGPKFSFEFGDIFLRAWAGPGSPNPPFQIYVKQFGSNWHDFYAYYDANGKQLDITPIDREINRCSNGGYCGGHEHVGVSVTREYLQQFSTTGLRFKLVGKSQNAIYEMPAGYIQGFLSVVPF
jgi:hypothetical protein